MDLVFRCHGVRGHADAPTRPVIDVDALRAEAFDHLRKVGCTRIGLNLKVDWRDGPGGRLTAKTAKVEQLLGRKLRT